MKPTKRVPITDSETTAATKMSAAAAPANSVRDGTRAIAIARGTTRARANITHERWRCKNVNDYLSFCGGLLL
jgi:hypothetical protein